MLNPQPKARPVLLDRRDSKAAILHCPACIEERDVSYERAAARARNNDFADTGGKDWT